MSSTVAGLIRAPKLSLCIALSAKRNAGALQQATLATMSAFKVPKVENEPNVSSATIA